MTDPDRAEHPDPGPTAETLTAGDAWRTDPTRIEGGDATGLVVWTIYREDGGYAAREFRITGGTADPEPTGTALLAPDITTIRDYLDGYLQLIPFVRSPADPEEIVETWL